MAGPVPLQPSGSGPGAGRCIYRERLVADGGRFRVRIESPPDGSFSDTEKVRTGTGTGTSPATSDGEADLRPPAPDADWLHWILMEDGSQPIMDRLLAERDGTL